MYFLLRTKPLDVFPVTAKILWMYFLLRTKPLDVFPVTDKAPGYIPWYGYDLMDLFPQIKIDEIACIFGLQYRFLEPHRDYRFDVEEIIKEKGWKGLVSGASAVRRDVRVRAAGAFLACLGHTEDGGRGGICEESVKGRGYGIDVWERRTFHILEW